MTHRTERIESVIHRAVQGVLAEGFADPRLDVSITATGVRISGDRKIATVLVIITPENKEKLAMHGLESAARHIRRVVADRVAIHHPPNLVFRIDKAYKRQASILEALSQISAETEPDPDAVAPPDPSPDTPDAES